jgi:hypothetical protein
MTFKDITQGKIITDNLIEDMIGTLIKGLKIATI